MSSQSILRPTDQKTIPQVQQPIPNTLTTSISPSNTVSLEEKIKFYISVNKPKLIILTPCFGSVCFVNFVSCLLQTFNVFRIFNIPVHIEFCKNDSLVSRARNNLIARAMGDETSTHFLFIDNDITWDPMDIIKLMLHDKPLVGGIYPLKHYHWEKLGDGSENNVKKWIDKKNNSQLRTFVNDDQVVQHNLLRYNINYLSNNLEIDNNLAMVKHLATGFMMIKREVIEKMSMAFPSTKYVDDVCFLREEENKYAYALFDCGVEEGHYFSEDWLFCKRWSKMGGNIFVDVSINLIHSGIEDYRGSYITTII